jgi:aminoglycoside phosphotransferase (APT) family kinase protein
VKSVPAGPVRPGDELDWVALEKYVHSQRDLPTGEMTVQQFTAGRANLTYLLDFSGTSIVLRRPPRGRLAPGSHDMAREHRVLSRLWRSYPRAPRSLHYCPSETVIGAPFVLIEYREGEVVTGSEVPDRMAHHHDAARRMCLGLLAAMADLHQIDIAAAGLADLGRPEGFAERQVSGWHDRLRRVSEGEAPAIMNEVAEVLRESLPRSGRLAVIHNDLKLDNCQFHSADPDTVTAVFDWDMATLGDPLFDLGNLLVASRPLPVWVLSTDEVADAYSDLTGSDVSDFSWYEGFALWRSAIVVMQLQSRFLRGESAHERLNPRPSLAPEIAERALTVIRAGR